MTDHPADVVVEKIRPPIEKARSVQDMEEARSRGLLTILNMYAKAVNR
jgi:hypothetical protein